jgi:hypothetical protein
MVISAGQLLPKKASLKNEKPSKIKICDTGGSGLTLQDFKNMYQFVKKRVS